MSVTQSFRPGAHKKALRPDLWLIHALQSLRRRIGRFNSGDEATVGVFRTLGFSNFQLDQLDTRRIESYLQKGERVKAVMHGHIHDVGGALIAATGSRILFLYDISSVSYFEAVAYARALSISINRTGYLSSVVIITKTLTYQIDYVNPQQAERFYAYIAPRISRAGSRKLTLAGRSQSN